MINLKLELNREEIENLKYALKRIQNVYTMEVLKQIEEQEYLLNEENKNG